MKTGEDPERDIARKREEWKARLQRSYAERAADTGEEDVVESGRLGRGVQRTLAGV